MGHGEYQGILHTYTESMQVEYEKTDGGTTMFVFEERVPQEYRAALLTPRKKRRIFKRLARHSNLKVEQHREEEIDARLKRRQSTRVVSAGKLQTSQIGKPLPASPQSSRQPTSPRRMTITPPRTVAADGPPRRRQQESSPRTSDGSPRSGRLLDRVGMACAGRWESTDSLEEGTRLMTLGRTRVHDSFKGGDSGRLICECGRCVMQCMLMILGSRYQARDVWLFSRHRLRGSPSIVRILGIRGHVKRRIGIAERTTWRRFPTTTSRSDTPQAIHPRVDFVRYRIPAVSDILPGRARVDRHVDTTSSTSCHSTSSREH